MLRFVIAVGTFFLITAGRFVCYYYTQGLPALPAAGAAVFYALPVGFVGFFLVDLVLARGCLRRKIRCIRFLLAYLLLIYLAEKFLPLLYSGGLLFPLGSAVAIILGSVLILMDSQTPKTPPNRPGGLVEDCLPAYYTRRHPLKTLLETLFRLLPYPVPAAALFRIGRASPESPVFVTGNYDLTVRRVAVALESSDCWLLVCDSRGINVWCASLAGHFGTDDVVRGIESTGLAAKVTHRRLVLPQLCAANVSPEHVRKLTGFSASFGPVSIKHVQSFMREPSQIAYRLATFDATHHLEMALGCPLLLCALLILIFNFFGFAHLLSIVPFLYAYSAMLGLLFPRPPMRSVGLWAIAVGIVVFGVQFFLALGMGLGTLTTAIVTALGAAYLVTEFSGWSPLVKYSLMPHGRQTLTLDRDPCTGCGRCREVCPKGVFEVSKSKATIARADECILCRACVFQCPARALAIADN